jgi:glycosyltransferase involved in cell wall biosynthesis
MYSAAHAMLFVPWFEGFGIPAAEAMRCGTPVILSERTSLPEIGGDAALYADPASAESICEAMIRVTADEQLRKSMSEKGYEQSLKFNWDDTALKVWDSIQRVGGSVS